MGYRLKYEAMLEVEAAVRRTGNPHLNLGKLSDAIGGVGRSKVRALRGFRNFGVDIKPGDVTVLPTDLATGLAVTGQCEILDSK
jgi:hypothetical protein